MYGKLVHFVHYLPRAIAPMADFGAPLTHTEILLPLGGKHILSPKPPDGRLEIVEFPRREVSDQGKLISY